jgi:hypothetical protein
MPGQKFGPAWFPGLIAVGSACAARLSPGARRARAWVAFPDWMQRARSRAAVPSVLGGLLFYVWPPTRWVSTSPRC